MYFLKRPDGKCRIGEHSRDPYLKLSKEQAGTVCIDRYYNHASSSMPEKATCGVTVKSTAYSIETDTISSGFQMEDMYDMFVDVYVKGDEVKLEVVTQTLVDYDYVNPTERHLAYVFPTGSTSDLSGFTRVSRITVSAEFGDDGSDLCTLYGTNTTTTLHTDSGSSVRLTTTKSTIYNVSVDVEVFSDNTKKQLEDIVDTVNDLSSESAAKFVSR